MKVPRINVGVDVVVYRATSMIDVTEVTIKVDSVDYIACIFTADYNGCKVAGRLYEYNPAPTMNNFLRAITEWDYHYRASDDSRLYEEGKEYEKALIALLKALPVADQHQLQKIVEIVVISNQP